MKISRNWIADYVDFSELSDQAFEDLITTRVAEVDCMYQSASPLKSALVGRILSRKKHPEKDKLSIVEVEVGKEKKTLICGAANCDVGLLVAYVPVGGEVISAKDQSTLKIEAREVAGVLSHGVLASELELGISDEHVGILILEEASAKSGELLSRYLGAPDTILEIDNKSLTHRPDLWSHFGFAREIAAILNKPLLKNPDSWADCTIAGRKLLESLGSSQSAANFSVQIDKDASCRRFAALEFANVSAKTSPLWLKKRLYSVGAGVRNLLIDLSNYVMQDIGQPNHAYDADSLSGKTIQIRKAKSGETFKGLDGADYSLDSGDIAICDASGVIALGGIIGGDTCSISEGTKRLLLESANFDPAVIRNSTKRHSLRTDASNRFEKSQSAYSVPLAIQRFAELLCEIDPEVEIIGGVVQDIVEIQKDLSIELDFDYIRARLGAEISDLHLAQILTSLSFKIAEQGKQQTAHVPYFRATRDVSIIDDLVEEIGRIYGYENVPEAIPQIQSVATPLQPLKKLTYQLKDALSAMGFAECDSYSFMDYQQAKSLGYEEEAIELENAIDTGQKYLRTSLVPAILKSIATNVKTRSNFALFECGRSYHKEEYASHSLLKLKKRYPNAACFERSLLTLAYLSGVKEAELVCSTSPELNSGADFFALLSAIKRLVRGITQAEVRALPLGPSSDNYRAWMHPYRAAQLVVGKTVFAELAEVRPLVIEDLKSRAVVAEIDLDLLLEIEAAEQSFKPIAKFPSSFFEMSIVMPEREHFSNLESFIEKQVSSEVLKGLEVVAVYSGKPLKDGEKSVSVRLSLRADDRTLSGEELQKIQETLMSAVEKSSYSLRS